jgi:tryptophan-rich sensory protein
MSRATSSALLVSLVALCIVVAAIGGLSTADGVLSWYPALDKPPWTPPNSAFGPIWTWLYLTMGVAAWDAARRDRAYALRVLGVFAVQLTLNGIWSPVFFSLNWLLTALVIISLLWVSLIVCIGVFARRSLLAAGLFVPYLAWISVAWSLNAWIWWFNA